jgi:hypothetical protein
MIKKDPTICYKKPTLHVRRYTRSKWKNGKRFSMQMIAKRKAGQKKHAYIAQNRL